MAKYFDEYEFKKMRNRKSHIKQQTGAIKTFQNQNKSSAYNHQFLCNQLVNAANPRLIPKNKNSSN